MHFLGISSQVHAKEDFAKELLSLVSLLKARMTLNVLFLWKNVFSHATAKALGQSWKFLKVSNEENRMTPDVDLFSLSSFYFHYSLVFVADFQTSFELRSKQDPK